MKNLALILLSLPLLLWGRFDAHPTRTCEAYNNLKHTQNTHHARVRPDRSYTVLKKHKGNYLVLLKGENPAQRWVDASCFTAAEHARTAPSASKHLPKKPAPTDAAARKPTLLVLSWHNAFCETHPRKEECRTPTHAEGSGHLVLHGLWPQPRSRTYCNVPKKIIAKDKHHQWRALPTIDTEPQTLELMDTYMPGYLSYLHKHEWIKHGTCYGTDPDTYFHDALSLAREVDRSAVGDLLRDRIGRRITLGEIRRAFDRAFGAGSGQRVGMTCDRGMLSELWISLRGRGDRIGPLLRRAPVRRKSRCNSGIVDPAGTQTLSKHTRRKKR
jgi:ribonuclease T2